jgi:hypothetical protein
MMRRSSAHSENTAHKPWRTLEMSKDSHQQCEALSWVSITCFGGVSSDLPFKAIQIRQHHGIIVDKYIRTSHILTAFAKSVSPHSYRGRMKSDWVWIARPLRSRHFRP